MPRTVRSLVVPFLAVAVLNGCAPKILPNDIVGTWVETAGAKRTLTFKQNHTYALGETDRGTWRIDRSFVVLSTRSPTGLNCLLERSDSSTLKMVRAQGKMLGEVAYFQRTN